MLSINSNPSVGQTKNITGSLDSSNVKKTRRNCNPLFEKKIDGTPANIRLPLARVLKAFRRRTRARAYRNVIAFPPHDRRPPSRAVAPRPAPLRSPSLGPRRCSAMQVGVVRVAEDGDFALLKTLVDEHAGWRREYDKASVRVWSRPPDPEASTALNLVKVVAEFQRVEPETLYDVLHDPHYRPHWDTHMLCSEDIGYLNINNDVGYYAMSCPSPLKNRDFVLQRSWLDTGTEQMILNHSVFHKNYPPRKGYIRATSHMTGFVIRENSTGGSVLGYVSQTDPQGRLPSWLVNTVTQSLAPKLARKLEKAALAYPEWKVNSDNANFMPWRWPDQINSDRITVADCVDTSQKGSRETLPDESLYKESKKKKNRRLSESD